mmetsp:Transcript_4419/g.11217  ORF Transcript_4419/g.11217 Transcript_4419/m.11217 type:complete len:549 (+) Transcript_4419:142-1788(+)
MSSDAGTFTLGVILALLGATGDSMGCILQKLSHDRAAAAAASTGIPETFYLRRRSWWRGFVLFVAGVLFSFAALIFIGQSTAILLGAWGLCVNLYVSPLILHEARSWRDILAVAVMIAGLAVAVGASKPDTTTWSEQQLLNRFAEPQVVVFNVILFGLIVAVYISTRTEMWTRRRRDRSQQAAAERKRQSGPSDAAASKPAAALPDLQRMPVSYRDVGDVAAPAAAGGGDGSGQRVAEAAAHSRRQSGSAVPDIDDASTASADGPAEVDVEADATTVAGGDVEIAVVGMGGGADARAVSPGGGPQTPTPPPPSSPTKILGNATATNDADLENAKEKGSGAVTAAEQPHTHQPPLPLHIRLQHVLLASLVATVTVTFGKATSEMLYDGIAGNSAFAGPGIFIPLVLLISLPAQLHFINTSLQVNDALFHIPVFYVFWVVGGTIAGGIVYNEFEGYAWWRWLLMVLGILIIFSGVYLAAARLAKLFSAMADVPGERPSISAFSGTNQPGRSSMASGGTPRETIEPVAHMGAAAAAAATTLHATNARITAV